MAKRRKKAPSSKCRGCWGRIGAGKLYCKGCEPDRKRESRELNDLKKEFTQDDLHQLQYQLEFQRGFENGVKALMTELGEGAVQNLICRSELLPKILQRCTVLGWEDRIYHPSGSGTLDLEVARAIWPNAKIE